MRFGLACEDPASPLSFVFFHGQNFPMVFSGGASDALEIEQVWQWWGGVGEGRRGRLP
jgi:hypothetical protein